MISGRRLRISSTYLSLLKSLLDLALLLVAGELGVLVVELGSEIVDVSLELVLLLLGIGDKLVLGNHGSLLLEKSSLGGVIERSGTAGNGQIALANLLLYLTGLLRTIVLLVGIHGLGR